MGVEDGKPNIEEIRKKLKAQKKRLDAADEAKKNQETVEDLLKKSGKIK